jgi:hypothetical protein
MLTEEPRQVGKHDDAALAARRLRLSQLAQLRQLPTNANDAASEVDVRPLKAEKFARAEAGEDGGADDGRVLCRCVFEERPDLMLLEDPLLSLLDRRLLVAFEISNRVIRPPTLANRVPEDARGRRQDTANRPGRKPLRL